MEQNLLSVFIKILQHTYTHVENDGSFAFDIEGSCLYIYFEQSNGLTDWKNNFYFPAAPYRFMPKQWYCHRGFLKVWKSIEPYIANTIMNPDISSVVIAGYSHGAALAVLCHEYVWFNRSDLHKNLHGYGFGCPRVVWGKKFPAERWNNFNLIINIDDVIYDVPPKIFGYHHVGNLISIGEHGKYNKIDAHRPQSYITELKILKL